MKRILLLSLMFLAATAFNALAQRTVSGTITDDTGESLPGVNVVIKGTTSGTTTDLDGNYRLQVDDGAVLVISFVGFETQEIEVGTRSVIDVTMGGVIELQEIVVTANAIEKEKRTIGYGISEVSGEDLTVSRESNIVNALIGKTTGVIVNQSSGNVGGSSQIIIRGITSLAGNNNPLWVVDGVPINNTQTVTGSRISGNRDTFNGAAVINPDDVESINVLKGAAATALYGSRAASGAILVTTKKGSASGTGKPRITVNSSVRIDDLFRVPDMQYDYAAGSFGKYDSSSIGNAWGPQIVGQTVSKQITNEAMPLQAYEDNYRDFYRQGLTLINNIAIADGNERGDYRFSFTSLNQDGILPNASLDRLTTSLNAGLKHNDWLQTRFSVQYITSQVQGTGAQGANDQNIIGWTTFNPTIDFNDYKPWIDEAGNQINNIVGVNNPFWLREENINERNDERFIGSLTQVISPKDNINITNRIGFDYNVDQRLITNRVGTITALTGTFDQDVIRRTQFNWDIIGDYQTQLGGDVSFTGLVGFNYNNRVFNRDRLEASDLAVAELFSPAASQTNVPTRGFSEARLMGVYGQIDLGYKNWLTLTLTGRNDWSSALPLDNNSYFYPSVSTAFVFTDAFGIANDILSFGKLRASWAQVGNTTNPYALNFTFIPQSEAFGQYSLNLNFPFLGQLGFSKTSVLPNQELIPEEQTTIEVGTELSFFNGRLGLDLTYYNTSNVDQIINQPIPESTGFAARTVNAAELETSGIEITLDGKILDGPFSWNTIVNFSTNEVKVKNLGVETSLLASAFSSVQVVAVDGGSIEIFGIPYLRDSATNRPIIDPDTGRRQPGAPKSFGSIFPDASWGFTNQFSYKNFGLSVTLDGKIGGKIKSATVENLWAAGFTTETADNRKGTYIDRTGVILNDDGTVRDNDVPIRSTEDFWETLDTDNNSATEYSIFDADFIKLREVALTYNFPRSIIGRTPFNAIQVGVEGRNLALLYSKVPHIDPEANLFGAGSAGFGIERNVVPSTRSIGFNLRLEF